MISTVERLVNLALCFAHARTPLTAAQIRAEVNGYPSGQDEAAFLRMFERDKDDLRASGLVIESDEQGCYRLDRSATFASELDLSPAEAATVRLVGSAFLGDPSFPFADDLALALAKLSPGLGREGASAASRLADEDPRRQGRTVAALADAAARRKRAAFSYTNSSGATAPREVEPYGLFLHDGRWYLVGRDARSGNVRTYTIARIAELRVNEGRPKSADFERPADFDVSNHIALPFQYGSADEEFEAVLRFEPGVAWRAERLSARNGTLAAEKDAAGNPTGALLWRLRARSKARLLRFAIEQGPGIMVAKPAGLIAELHAGLERVEALHG
ncbi:MAG: helix-turn-helix transcriptional regulator [Coriobacteriia bacterium]